MQAEEVKVIDIASIINRDNDNIQNIGDNIFIPNIGNEPGINPDDDVNKDDLNGSNQDVDVDDDNNKDVDIDLKGGNNLDNQNPEPKTVDYKSVINEMSKKGFIGKLDDVVFSDGDDDENPIAWDEYNIETEDDFFTVMDMFYSEKYKSQLENKVDLSGVSERTKELIEIDKAGGDVTGVLNLYRTYTNPIEGIDDSEKEGQLEIIRHYWSMKSDAVGEKIANETYSLWASQSDEFIADKAEECKNAINKTVDDTIKNYKKQLDEQNAARVEVEKKFKKDLKQKASEKFQINEKVVSRIVDFGTKKLNDKGSTAATKAFLDLVNNPEEAPEILLFLMDREEYKRQITVKETNKTKQQTFKKIMTKRRENPSSKEGNDVIEEIKEKGTIDLSKYLNT